VEPMSHNHPRTNTSIVALACPECAATWQSNSLPSHCPSCGKGGVILKGPVDDPRQAFGEDRRVRRPL
jgi:hypothetical protein